MPDDVEAPQPDDVLTPDAVANHTFHTAFRGFDPVEVRAFLGRVADALRAAEAAGLELGGDVAGDVAQAEDASSPEPEVAHGVVEGADTDVDPRVVLAEAVAEAEEVLRDARERAQRMEEEAVAEGRRLVDAARSEAETLLERARGEAEAELRSAKSKARAEVGREATRLRAEAEQSAAETRVDAERHAAKLKQQAEQEAAAVIEGARERGREMVVEAQAARERMLTDLARRKRAAQAQIEQLRAGRDRMLEALKAARRSVDEVTLRFDAADSGGGRRDREGDRVDAQGDRGRPGPDDAASEPARGEAGAADEAEGNEPAAPTAPALPSLPGPSEARSEGVRIIGTRPTIDAPRAGQVAPEGPSGQPPETAGVSEAARGQARPQPSGSEADEQARGAEGSEGGARRGERRSSALRILRRGRGVDRDEPDQPDRHDRPEGGQGHQMPSEGVRILAPTDDTGEAADAEPAAEAEPVPDPNRAGDAEVVGGGGATDAEDQRRAEVEDQRPAGVEDQRPAGVDQVEDERPAEVEEVDDERPSEAEEEEGTTEVGGAAENPPGGPEPAGVEDIFARIRAEREAATAAARQVLDDTAPDASPDAGPGPTPEEGAEEADSSVAVAATSGKDEQAPSPSGAPDSSEATAAGAVSNADEAVLQRRDEALAELEEGLTRRLKRTLQDEQNAALDRLRTHRGSLVSASLLGTVEEQAAPYEEVARSHLEPAAHAGAATSPMGAASVSVADLATQLARDIAESLRQRLDRALEQATQEELELAGVAERVNATYREWKTHRIERITGHYLSAAYNRGIFLATPEGTALRWLVDDEGPCPDCDDNALSGSTPRGEAYPTGQMLPPAHVGCRCLLVRATA